MVPALNRIARLNNPIQEYDWGSRTFLPELLNIPAPPESPQAELWMGSHPLAPSEVVIGETLVPLPQLIAQNPENILGNDVAKKFDGQLPFLFKILAAAKPLSIQAHPDLNHAREGYERETGLGIPPDAPDRNYKDRNHKPEILCALTPFWALKGFRSAEDIIRRIISLESPLLQESSEDILKEPRAEGLKHFFSALMTLDPETREDMISQALKGVKNKDRSDMAFQWVLRLHRWFPGDAGILAPMFLNLVYLQPGEAISLPNGELHAYLEGAAIELMANSDNVLRGGLTNKHMDVPELLQVLRFSETRVELLKPQWDNNRQGTYPTRAEEFVLSVIKPQKGSPYTGPENHTVEILICTEGSAEMTDLDRGAPLSLVRGASALVPACQGSYEIQGEATLYKASVPME